MDTWVNEGMDGWRRESRGRWYLASCLPMQIKVTKTPSPQWRVSRKCSGEAFGLFLPLQWDSEKKAKIRGLNSTNWGKGHNIRDGYASYDLFVPVQFKTVSYNLKQFYDSSKKRNGQTCKFLNQDILSGRSDFPLFISDCDSQMNRTWLVWAHFKRWLWSSKAFPGDMPGQGYAWHSCHHMEMASSINVPSLVMRTVVGCPQILYM